ncbi:unnamed protein product, partial [Meganyctiphanes norvegica]
MKDQVGAAQGGRTCWIAVVTLVLLITCGQDVWGIDAEGKCVWYGQCGSNPLLFGKTANCPYSGPPKPLETASVLSLTAACPEFVQEYSVNGTISTCCDGTQVNALLTQMAAGLAMLQRCPTCVRNFRLNFCYMTCSPYQSNFMDITGTANASDTKKTVITSVKVHVANKFVEGVYRSCQDVSMPSTGDAAISLMCGAWGAQYCTGQRWFNYMGSTSNGFSPFQINYAYEDVSNGTTKPLNKTIIPCSEPVDENSRACACVDCKDACPVPPPLPPLPQPFDILGYDGLAVIMVFFFLLISSAFLTVYICFTCRTQSLDIAASMQSSSDVGEPNQIERLGASMEDSLERLFRAWGSMCAEHPWTVLIVGVILAVGMSVGIIFLRVTTDPVELWASPLSRARKEKDYFDRNFEPFYRTEMLIIRPVGVDPATAHESMPAITIW